MMNKIAKTLQIFSVAVVAAFFSMSGAFAQEAEITDEKLEAYVMVMDSVKDMQATLSEDMSTMIQEHELMEGGKIYRDIKAANGDTVKLAEQGITPEQIAAYNEIEATLTKRTEMLNTSFADMVKEHIGVSEYKNIKAGLKNDEELKTKYDALMAEREEADAAAEEGEAVAEEGVEGGEAEESIAE